MTEAIWVACIVGVCNILAQMLSRWVSHREHKATAKDVRDIKRIVNGKDKTE